MKYVHVIEKAADGSFSAYVPDLPAARPAAIPKTMFG
jgi:predicted RNase H-like HicB family nuclease